MRGGRDTVDHIPGHNFHDDVANAVCGAMVYVAQRAAQTVSLLAFDVMTGQVLGGPHGTPLQPGQSEEARAARERAMQSSIPRAPAAPGQQPSSTQLFYESGGGGWTPPGGWTRGKPP